MVVEVKPKKETKMPTTNPKRRTKSWAYSVRTYAVNQAKWKAAKEFCKDNNYEFKTIRGPENEINHKIKKISKNYYEII